MNRVLIVCGAVFFLLLGIDVPAVLGRQIDIEFYPATSGTEFDGRRRWTGW